MAVDTGLVAGLPEADQPGAKETPLRHGHHHRRRVHPPVPVACPAKWTASHPPLRHLRQWKPCQDPRSRARGAGCKRHPGAYSRNPMTGKRTTTAIAAWRPGSRPFPARTVAENCGKERPGNLPPVRSVLFTRPTPRSTGAGRETMNHRIPSGSANVVIAPANRSSCAQFRTQGNRQRKMSLPSTISYRKYTKCWAEASSHAFQR